MASTFSSMASSKFTMFGYTTTRTTKTHLKRTLSFKISAQQQQQQQQQQQEIGFQEMPTQEGEKETQKEETKAKLPTTPRPVEKQLNTQNKNMNRDQGGEWLSSTTRHVRLYAAYIDMETFAMDQTQTDKLTLLLDPTEEFLWTPRTENMVYSYFQELVDHYEGAPLTEYTLRLIGSDIEHYIRKLLYDGEIQYNMEARVLNFSMGKPRIGFSYNEPQLQDVSNNE